MAVQVLGSGYNTDTQSASPVPCVNTSGIIYTAGAQGTVNFGYNLGFQDIAAEQGFTMWLNEGIEYLSLFSEQAGIQFISSLQTTELSQSLLFTQSITCPTATFIPAGYGVQALTPFGAGAYNAGPAPFRDACGNQFISQVNFGATLAVAIQMLFLNADFTANFYASSSSEGFLGLYQSFSSITANVDAMAGIGSIFIVGYQNGGNVAALPNIFAEYNGNYYVTTCTPANIAPCQEVINNVVNYSVNEFATQLTCDGNASPTGYTYQPFTDLGLNSTQSLVAPEVISARDQLSSALKTNNNLLSSINAITNSVGQYMSNSTLAQVQTVVSQVNYNLNILQGQNGVSLCYSNPSNCPEEALEILLALSTVNQTFIDQFNVAYNLTYAGQISGPITIYSGIAIPYGENNYVVRSNSATVNYIAVQPNNGNLTVSYSNGWEFEAQQVNPNIWNFCAASGDQGICLTLFGIANPDFVDLV
jgi:hypothetical protein